MTTEPDWIRDVLSPARFAPYLARTGGDTDAAIQLYWWNVDVSAAFYTPLHRLEMALRNGIHQRLSVAYGGADWWASAPLQDNGVRLVGDAARKVASRSGSSTADDMVTELSFGFWASLISRRYDRTLWVPHLHKAFPGYRGPRERLHREVHTVLLLRNRIMHHEPIHHRHLQADHQTILRVLMYLAPSMVDQLRPNDHVAAVLRDRPDHTSSAGPRR
ncbi:hypothetical protein [Kribbella sp. NPDC051718]|uniref:hypothetical protein n=1 Tax=Kribbella sp. NPDC051718 TaxID=3155168 RepID=UPI00342BEF1F